MRARRRSACVYLDSHSLLFVDTTQEINRPPIAHLTLQAIGYVVAGFSTSLLMEYFNGRESSLFYIIPGFFFGLAIGLGHIKLMENKLIGVLGTMALSIFAWGLSLVLCLIVFSIVTLYSNVLLGFLCIGAFSAVLTYVLLSIFFQTGLSWYYGLLTGLAGGLAFMVVYLQTDHNIEMIGDFKYLYVIWQTLVGFIISLGLSNKKLIPLLP